MRKGSSCGVCLLMCMLNSVGMSSVWLRLFMGKSLVMFCRMFRNIRN